MLRQLALLAFCTVIGIVKLEMRFFEKEQLHNKYSCIIRNNFSELFCYKLHLEN